jgi:hypothetical protein
MADALIKAIDLFGVSNFPARLLAFNSPLVHANRQVKAGFLFREAPVDLTPAPGVFVSANLRRLDEAKALPSGPPLVEVDNRLASESPI